ncbi:MAG: adenine deaminase [Lachnospiraceae bacterium]|nr:adenine deaminase [Lachnospiraceae bacterium]
MYKLKPKNKKEVLKAALGKIPADLALKNCQVVNVFTGEILPAVVYVKDGFIVHVELTELEGPYNADEVFDGEGKYLIPGFIDAHMHIESSMMVPRNIAKVIVPHGTTTIVHDPHELANVYGVEGVQYMHDNAEGIPMRQLVDIPSCVPAVPGCENAGAEFFADEIRELAKLDRVVGLAEVMDFLGVMHGDDRMMDIIEAAEEAGLYIQGHAPCVSGRALSAYICGGPSTCHETTGSEEALEKLRMGLYVDASESSIIKNVEAVWNGVKNCKFHDTLALCTDDRESDDLLHVGHMNAAVRKAVACGMDPVAAIKSATINTAREIGVEHLGAIAPGYVADMVLTKNLTDFWADAVFYEGKLVAKEGKLTEPIEDMVFELETRNSMNLAPVTLEDLTIKAPVDNGPITVNIMEYLTMDSGVTIKNAMDFDTQNGRIPLREDMAFVAVLNRYGKGTKSLGIVKNFGLKEGAIASTVSHDSHNLTIVYLDPKDAVVAANELISCGGGMTAVKDGEVLNTLRLEVGGLMTKLDAEELTVEAAKMKEIERGMGLTVPVNPLLRIVSLALPVVPYVKITDLGMVNTEDQTMIPLFEQII